ncbi:MAG: hydroxyacid dehydrogenase [Nanoarchaeota archaeon]|nr:hydroxyacid dehydrogenase [Nanoarchaeota archaeon]
MEIAFFDIKDKVGINYFKKNLKEHKLIFFEEAIQDVPTRKYKNAQIIVVFIYSNFSKQIIDKLPKLKLILTQSTGFDHIDIQYCKEKGIQVGYVPYYGENTVAEHTFALMLNLSRKVHKSYLRTVHDDFSIDGLRGFDLKGKVLGIIGVGHIGLHVIRIAKGFGMHVKAFDINNDSFLSEVLHFDYASLDEILKTSDIITLHMPLNKNTYHFLDENRLKMTKKGVIIINTSRGALINTNTLYNFLKKGHIGGAALDVIEGEEHISHEDELLNNPKLQEKLTQIIMDKNIFKMDNVIFTPHNAFNSQEALNRIMETTIENINTFKSNGEVKYKIPLK